eukprot:CAMPEP_0113701858 /NCGR_PEP_ID=MMETSP0038_2-20120614/24829_1 /TAXON_ID=2898 /ORGANISM="Cryptomonas paramecium" /LENGTH=143 /DNA_ID=CAMNT_0000625839 /DNA_START=88 /DNA_END=519 /DNA_ORIENTATION=+ /assembly_acc=CAM_ASM_000170
MAALGWTSAANTDQNLGVGNTRAQRPIWSGDAATEGHCTFSPVPGLHKPRRDFWRGLKLLGPEQDLHSATWGGSILDLDLNKICAELHGVAPCCSFSFYFGPGQDLRRAARYDPTLLLGPGQDPRLCGDRDSTLRTLVPCWCH